MTCYVKALPPTVIRRNKTHGCRSMYVIQACVYKHSLEYYDAPTGITSSFPPVILDFT